MKSVLLLSNHKNQFCQCQWLRTNWLYCWCPPSAWGGSGLQGTHPTARSPHQPSPHAEGGCASAAAETQALPYGMASELAHRSKFSISTARQLPAQKNICALFHDL